MADKSIIGIDLGGTNIRAGRVLNSGIAEYYSQLISSAGSEEEVLAEVIDSVRKVFDKTVSGIGIGVPSVVDSHKGIVYNVQNIPSWKEVHLKEILESEFKVPVNVNNDASCFVVGEKYFGAGANYKSIVGLIIGTGLGAGMYIHDKVYLGANSGAGEFGMVSYKDSYYEKYCSGQFFRDKHNVSGEDLFEAANAGDKKALLVFNEFGIHIGNAITTILFTVDPEIIILGGSVSKSIGFFNKGMNSVLENFPYGNTIRNLKIVKSSLNHAAILGAAALFCKKNGIKIPKEEILSELN